ncbi:MAG: N-6 DNA methylase [Acidimicrobiales bacterium]
MSPEEPVLVAASDIADLAEVGRSTVSNWVRRHDDFPEPRHVRGSTSLYDWHEVEDWLLSSGRIERPVPRGGLLWYVADAVRGSAPAEDFADVVRSWLVYLELCDVGDEPEPTGPVDLRDLDVPEEVRWPVVRGAPDEELPMRLQEVAEEIEARNPSLSGLLDRLAPDPFPDPLALRSWVAELQAAASEDTRYGLWHEATTRLLRLDRHAAEYTTPDSLAYLMAQLAGPTGGTVIDPACGTGSLLLLWATSESAPSEPTTMVGVDRNPSVLLQARAQFLLNRVRADLIDGDAFKRDPGEWPDADLVLLDPPLSMNKWGDADVMRRDTWRWGVPPHKSADYAWIQLVLSMLKSTGRAVVALTPRSLRPSGSELEIRQALLSEGLVEAVIELPNGLRPHAAVGTVVWLLRGPGAEREDTEVLLMDATRLGDRDRRGTSLDQSDVDSIVATVERWRKGEPIDDPLLEAVAVPVEEIHQAAPLSTSRYLPMPEAPGLAALEAQVQQLEKLQREVGDAISGLSDSEAVGAIPHVTSAERVRLGDVASVNRFEIDEEELADLDSEGIVVDFGRRLTVVRGADVDSPVRRGLLVTLREPDEQLEWWLFLWLRGREFATLAERFAHGDVMPSLKPQDVEEFYVPLPPSSGRRAVLDELRRGFAQLEAAEQLARSLKEYCDVAAEIVVGAAERAAGVAPAPSLKPDMAIRPGRSAGPRRPKLPKGGSGQ